ncbi:PpiC-type peptidyl-prolyl cis-trans isomerase [Candidatus Omnitrophus magneticus]|uniref:PpiC-type peptidyl-prolyl cis-trans isomerase n=1 Tax=Candidatus Omnitrophus magneticus TaxID=1609969 RepID=A0A0F0CS92_9BACT|nr:PpiC-type peptidyl-prolyl cis-trans isomerase [Candidatus Omnitrophus magneticus]
MVFSINSGIKAVAEVVDKVIVIVNDEVVTQKEFDRIFNPIKQNYETNFTGEELKNRIEEARKSLLEQLINSKLAISVAKKASIKIDDVKLGERITTIKSYYPSEEKFLQALNEKGTNLTEFNKDIKEQMMAQEVVDKEVASKIVIAPAEINELYDKNKDKLIIPKRNKVREITVRKGERTDGVNPIEKIKDIQARLKKGEDFSAIATKESEGPFAQKGGDMGLVAEGQLLPAMAKVVFSLPKGQVSDVVETDLGYHLFIVDSIEESKQLKLEEATDFLKGQLFKKRFEENLVKWLEEKRKNAFIQYK